MTGGTASQIACLARPRHLCVQRALISGSAIVPDEAQEIVAPALARRDARAGALAAAWRGDEDPAAEAGA